MSDARIAAVPAPQQPKSSAERRRRRSVRRALTVDCRLECDCWDGPVVLKATDVSTEGLWVETPYALDPGQELVVSFRVPDPRGAPRLWAVAEVARVGMWRRREDPFPIGMGLRFTYLSADDRERLAASLLGRPPPLPHEALVSTPPPLPLHKPAPADDLALEPAASSGTDEADDELPAVLCCASGDV